MKFTKKDLRTGMRVDRRDGSIMFVVENLGEISIASDSSGHMFDSEINTDLTCNTDKKRDIIRVYNIPTLMNDFFNIRVKGMLLWERKNEPTLLTHNGIEWSEATLKSMIDKEMKS